jgi:hypothetical protein
MALQPTNIPLSVVDGIDTKTDEKNVLATKWLQAENVVFNKTNAASKDQGFAAITTDVDEGTDISSGSAISVFNNELIQYSDNKLYSYSKSKSKWYDKGFVSNAIVDRKTIGVTNTSTFRMYSATISNLTAYVYAPEAALASQAIYCRIYDEQTNSILTDHTIYSGGNNLLRVGAVGNYFVIFYIDGGIVKYKTINTSTIFTVSSATTLSSTDITFADCASFNSRLYFTWFNDSAGGTVDTIYFDSNLNVSSALQISSTTPNLLCVSGEDTNKVRITYGISTVLYDASLSSQIHAPAAYGSGFMPTNATFIQDPENAQASIVLYEDNADSGQIGIKKGRITSGGTFTDLGYVMYAVNMISKAQVLNGQVYVVVGKRINDDDDLGTRTYFLISIEGQVIAKVADEVGVRSGVFPLYTLYTDTNELNFFGPEYYQAFDVLSPSADTATSINKYVFDFSSANNYFDAILGKQLHVAGGVLSSYDADRVTEHGFLETPIAPTLDTLINTSPTAGAGSGDPADYPQTRNYVAVFAWNDSQGQIHRSAPSLPLAVEIPDETTKVRLKVRPLTITNKENVEIEIYSTEANGTILYKNSALVGVSSAENKRLANDPTSAAITYDDVAPDSEIIKKEILYTMSGELENHAPISSKYVVSNKSRIFLLGSDGYTIQYSKLKESNIGVTFNTALITFLDSIGGPGKALGLLDDNLVIFKGESILYQAGEGPNNNGVDSDYKQPVPIPSDVGCDDPASAVSTPMGILFKSKKGIYILRRNLSVEYIGAPVEDFNDETITGAVLLATKNQVRFTTAEGTALIYDYFHNRWSTRDNVEALDALNYEDCFTYLKSNGVVMQQSGWSDNGTYVPMLLESSWIQFAGVQGYQRFYKMLILGEYLNAHNLKVSFAYDFIDSYVDSVTVDATELFAAGTKAYQIEVGPKRQKCQAFKFKIETLYDGVYGADCTLSNFLLVIGAKQSSNKLPATQKAKAT